MIAFAYRRSGVRGLFCACVLASHAYLCTGCGDDADPVVVSSSGPAGAADGENPADLSCTTGDTQACSCAGATADAMIGGTRSCYQGRWTTCACTSSSATTTETDEGQCLGGRYEGSFEGSYRSEFLLGAGIPVIALNLTGEPGLAFTLEQTVDSSSEFPVYVVKDGYVKGTADGLFPFEGALTGMLDCKTNKFTGQLEGGYSIVVPAGLNEAKFIGPVEGDYDPVAHSFSLGMWTLMEKDATLDVLGDAGGEGTWEATYTGPVNP
jgi:hypothetical protein